MAIWWCRRVGKLLAAWALMGVTGCGGVKLVPVAGNVSLDGKALAGAEVHFIPDAAKGNQAVVSCSGRSDAKGQYTLATTHGAVGKGAPLGWYKVSLSFTPSDARPERVQIERPQVVVPGKYLDAETTPLVLEVVENPAPGAYDLALKTE
jgi:hypothetical protein